MCSICVDERPAGPYGLRTIESIQWLCSRDPSLLLGLAGMRSVAWTRQPCSVPALCANVRLAEEKGMRSNTLFSTQQRIELGNER